MSDFTFAWWLHVQWFPCNAHHSSYFRWYFVMNKNYLLFLKEHFLQRPMCHRKITFSRGRFSECKALGNVALESPWDHAERDNLHEGGMPLQSGKMPTWARRETQCFPRVQSQSGWRRRVQTTINVTGPNPARSLFLENTTILSCFCGLEACISLKAMELEDKG